MGAGYTIMVALMLAQSRGSVRLADAAAAGTAPVIDPNYYTEPRDLVAVADGLRAARNIGGAPALGRWRGEEVLPGREMRSEQNLRAYPRTNLRSYSHYADTCRIGLAEDGVVDTDLRVHGISGLRVADASVMPLPISANTNPTVYAIAERAAVLLRALATLTRPVASTSDGDTLHAEELLETGAAAFRRPTSLARRSRSRASGSRPDRTVSSRRPADRRPSRSGHATRPWTATTR